MWLLCGLCGSSLHSVETPTHRRSTKGLKTPDALYRSTLLHSTDSPLPQTPVEQPPEQSPQQPIEQPPEQSQQELPEQSELQVSQRQHLTDENDYIFIIVVYCLLLVYFGIHVLYQFMLYR